MPYPKFKSETYNCQGGINTKISLYVAKEGEFLNLQNWDFRVIGALSSAPGSTAFTIAGARSTSPISGIGALINGSSISQFLGATYVAEVATDSFNLSLIHGGTFQTILPFWSGVANTIPTSFVNAGALFGCNGSDFWTWQNSTLPAWQFSLPKPVTLGASSTVTTVGSAGGLSGFLTMFYSLVRQDGLYGPSIAATYPVSGCSQITMPVPSTINSQGGFSFGSFGLSGIQAWAQLNTNLPVGLTQLLGLTTGGNPQVSVGFNFTASGGWALTTPQPLDYQGSFFYGPGLTQGASGPIGTPFGWAPQVIEYFANALFSACVVNTSIGLASANPSRVYFSSPGTPEIADYANFLDVDTNDSGYPTAMKRFFTLLCIWKYSKTFALSGSSNDDFVLTNMSSIYGCISSRACCVWNQKCWFLDEKGICEFDGANVSCISNKIQDIFDRMNIPAARTQAIMMHAKDRNEVWCAIPIDGSSSNNIVVVFDYLAQGWYTRTTPAGSITALASIPSPTAKERIFFGTTGGLFGASFNSIIGTFGSSIMGDFGTGFTQVMKSRYMEDMGNTVTKMFRTLYIDAAVPAGVTYPVTVNLYADRATTPTYSTTMALSAFQTRVQFGVPAKGLAVEIIYSGTSFLQLNGFTLDYRFQRAV